jgi:FtsZ-binding cell division protein ZapB
MLLKLTKELEEQKADLTTLSNEVKESKALLQTLKNQIEKERKIHKRQVWQNRFWCILIGAGIGFVAGR